MRELVFIAFSRSAGGESRDPAAAESRGWVSTLDDAVFKRQKGGVDEKERDL